MRRAAALLALAVMLVSACSEVEEAAVSGYEPAALEQVPGSDGATRVTFTAEGARRVGLDTAPVRRDGRRGVVPYGALIYDPHGATYVYTVTGPRSFLRQAVEVDRIEGARALLSRGPAAGATIVTVGAAEVYGAELEIAGGH